jgi:arylsulfatase A-like enzyme
VTVNCVPWDHHGTAPQLKTEEGARLLIPPLDRALGALIDDLIDRGLYESTLVVAMGEFGRTPASTRTPGATTGAHLQRPDGLRARCAWARSSAAAASGASTSSTAPVDPQDVAATVYHHLGIDARSVTFEDRTGRPILPPRSRRADPRARRLSAGISR